jgi:propionyl-CoA carboxylase beta chain
VSGGIDDVIMLHAKRLRIVRALAMLRGRAVQMPGRKHDNLPVLKIRPD